jgi:hypothetical protein
VSSIPKKRTAFIRVNKLEEFAGVYKNLGEDMSKRTMYLSSLIWPLEIELDHSSISRIEVKAKGDKTLDVVAWNNDLIKKQSKLILGIDFKIEAGCISLDNGFGMFGFKVGEPIFGSYYSVKKLGIDVDGNGKYQEELYLIGLIYLVFPVAGKYVDEVRFVKVSE